MHGSYGSPDENWFRWLESELNKVGEEVILKQFPVDNWDEVVKIGYENISKYSPQESLSSWEDFFVKNIYPLIKDEKFNFIGHSIAPIFMLHMLSKYDLKINKAVFVSPFFSIPDKPEVWQFYPVNKTFYTHNFDFERIKNKIDTSYVVYGDNDPYVPATESPLFAEKLSSKITVIPNGRHCGSNFVEFPTVLELLEE